MPSSGSFEALFLARQWAMSTVSYLLGMADHPINLEDLWDFCSAFLVVLDLMDCGCCFGCGSCSQQFIDALWALNEGRVFMMENDIYC